MANPLIVDRVVSLRKSIAKLREEVVALGKLVESLPPEASVAMRTQLKIRTQREAKLSAELKALEPLTVDERQSELGKPPVRR